MQSKVNYTVVGLFVVLLTTFLFVAILWLTSIGHGKEYGTYLVYVHEDVTGLSVESPVRFNGVSVGYVKSLELDPANPKLVKLVLRIEKHTPVTTSTYAILNAQGVTGIVYVNLKAETETAPLLVAVDKEPYPVIPSRPSLLMQLSTVLPEITADIQTLSGNVSHVLDAENQQSLKEALKNMATITKTLADNSETFSQTLSNISKASNDLPSAMQQLNQTLSSVNQLSIQMKQTSKKISNTMQSGQMVIHNFSNQVVPNAQQALSNLSHATQSVQQLTDELQRDPSMLVRGKAPAVLGPGEK
ncbi:MAG: hypothetical protein A3E82_09485 [Gammaproteobacteria bacterium RIFCSPHIGHO2_12_FULL_38_11]|nr:MAG: hypothetical protein A3E82_09485 [Gammaproteobacteria bacterium RIFCSPHIGHO2_12_FULL_38_11]